MAGLHFVELCIGGTCEGHPAVDPFCHVIEVFLVQVAAEHAARVVHNAREGQGRLPGYESHHVSQGLTTVIETFSAIFKLLKSILVSTL